MRLPDWIEARRQRRIRHKLLVLLERQIAYKDLAVELSRAQYKALARTLPHDD